MANYTTKDCLRLVKSSGVGAKASITAQAYSTIASYLDLAAAESVTFRATIKYSEYFDSSTKLFTTLLVASSLGSPTETLSSACLVHPSSFKVHLPTCQCPVCYT